MDLIYKAQDLLKEIGKNLYNNKKSNLSVRSLRNNPGPLQRWSRTHGDVHRRLQALAGLSQQGLTSFDKKLSTS